MTFSEWQPKYAEHGISTFPINSGEKKPATRGWQKVGKNGSRDLAAKFPEATAFGLMTRRNRITVLDVDTRDERVLADALDRHGPTPFIVKSQSGNRQAWYRHNGERRQIRPWPDKTIDILGDGYVVAPPSKGEKGRYEIIQGSLDDLASLPTLQGLARDLYAMPRDLGQRLQPIPKGRRDDEMFNRLLHAARHCDDFDSLLDVGRTLNMSCNPPLSDAQVVSKAESAWGYEERGENWVGGEQRVVLERGVVDDLAYQDPDAFTLFSILKACNWERDKFILANNMAESLGWTLRKFQRARKTLSDRGYIRCLHPGGRKGKLSDPPIYAWR